MAEPGGSTGTVDVVEDVRGRLARLERVPVQEHVPAYAEVHRVLQQALARLDGG